MVIIFMYIPRFGWRNEFYWSYIFRCVSLQLALFHRCDLMQGYVLRAPFEILSMGLIWHASLTSFELKCSIFQTQKVNVIYYFQFIYSVIQLNDIHFGYRRNEINKPIIKPWIMLFNFLFEFKHISQNFTYL